MGAPFEAGDAMQTAPLMMTVRNGRGAAMLECAVRARRVTVVADGGHGGRSLPSGGDRRASDRWQMRWPKQDADARAEW